MYEKICYYVIQIANNNRRNENLADFKCLWVAYADEGNCALLIFSVYLAMMVSYLYSFYNLNCIQPKNKIDYFGLNLSSLVEVR